MKRLILAILLVMLVPAMAFSVGTGTYTISYNPDQATNYKHKVFIQKQIGYKDD